MITQYEIISGHSTDDLTKKVNVKIKEGWQPLGGLCCVLKGTTPIFMQTMVKGGA